MPHATIQLTTGAVGTGKTYSRVHWIVTEFLPKYDGTLITNLPLHKDVIIDYVSKRYKISPDKLVDRIQFISSEVLQTWFADTGNSGPWDYFREMNLTNTHIMIDEVHNFVPNSTRFDPKVQKWVQFFGEIRHRGCTIELITQDEGNIAKSVREKAIYKMRIVSCETESDEMFKIPYGDWYELRAAFTREYCPKIAEVTTAEGVKKDRQRIRSFYRDKFYFKFYDSYSSPFAGGLAGTAQKHEFQRRSFFGVLWWFFCRNYEPLLKFAGIFIVVILGCSGMGAWLFGDVLVKRFVSVGSANFGAVAKTPKSTKPSVVVNNSPNNVNSNPSLSNPDSPELQKLKSEIKAVKDVNTRLLSQLGINSSVTMLFPDKIVLNNGYIYSIGDIIDYGVFKNKTLESIDYAKRSFKLSDGNVYRLGLLRQSTGD